MILETKLAIILTLLVIFDAISSWIFIIELGWFAERNPLGLNGFSIIIALLACFALIWVCSKINESNIYTRMGVLMALAIAFSWRLCGIIINLSLILNHL